MTSGAALSPVTREAQSSERALGYSGTYALASIRMTLGDTPLMHAA